MYTLKVKKVVVVIDETLTTRESGFINLWLSRNEMFIIEIICKMKRVEGKLTTFDEKRLKK